MSVVQAGVLFAFMLLVILGLVCYILLQKKENQRFQDKLFDIAMKITACMTAFNERVHINYVFENQDKK